MPDCRQFWYDYGFLVLLSNSHLIYKQYTCLTSWKLLTFTFEICSHTSVIKHHNWHKFLKPGNHWKLAKTSEKSHTSKLMSLFAETQLQDLAWKPDLVDQAEIYKIYYNSTWNMFTTIHYEKQKWGLPGLLMGLWWGLYMGKGAQTIC